MKKLLLIFILFLTVCTITIKPLDIEHQVSIDVGTSETNWEEFISDFGLDGFIAYYVNMDVVGKYLVQYESNGHNNLIVIEIADDIDPNISLVGSGLIEIELGEEFSDPGVEIEDNYDSNMNVIIDSDINGLRVGDYMIKYTVYDSSGNKNEVIRAVSVRDTIKPEIALVGDSSYVIDFGDEFIDEGVVCTDLSTCTVEVVGNVDSATAGDYILAYTGYDLYGNSNSVLRTVTVLDETIEAGIFDIEIHQNLLDNSDKKVGYEMIPTYIVIHNTGNVASAMNEISYLHNSDNDTFTSFHFAVDEFEVWQGIDTSYNAWHAGDGDGEDSYNRNSIGIEIARSLTDDDEMKDQAIYNAAVLTANIMVEFGIPLENIVTHFDASEKYCPHDIFDRYGFERFKDLVESIYDEIL